MWITKREYIKLHRRIAELEETVKSQQFTLEAIRTMKEDLLTFQDTVKRPVSQLNHNYS